MKRMFIESIVN